MSDRIEDRDAFFNGFRAIEQHAVACKTKGAFLDNVLTARESITFGVIDRCREAVLQMRQSHYVVKATHTALIETSFGVDNKERLDDFLATASTAMEAAASALDEITSWVPSPVNTRAFAPAAGPAR